MKTQLHLVASQEIIWKSFWKIIIKKNLIKIKTVDKSQLRLINR